jgi:hypothetical protein
MPSRFSREAANAGRHSAAGDIDGYLVLRAEKTTEKTAAGFIKMATYF